jgi:hypothetical protein
MTVDVAAGDLTDYRPIADFIGYVISADAAVWSVGREVRTKGGATRVTAGKQLKPDDKGRVALRRDGKTYKLRADQLARETFPPVRHRVTYDRITLSCRWCGESWNDYVTGHCAQDPDLVIGPALFRCPRCTTAVTRLPDHFPTSPYK